jgi:hypothetical protein
VRFVDFPVQRFCNLDDWHVDRTGDIGARRRARLHLELGLVRVTGAARQANPSRATPPERNIIARRRWVRCGALKIPRRDSVCMEHTVNRKVRIACEWCSRP